MKQVNLNQANDIEIGKKAPADPRARQCAAAGLHIPVPVDFRFSYAPGTTGPVGMLAKTAACLNCGMVYDIPPLYGIDKAEDAPVAEA